MASTALVAKKAAHLKVLPSSTSSSPSSSAKSRLASKDTLRGLAYLQPFLPLGWQSSFTLRRAGRYWGLVIVCPVCQVSPPAEIDYGNRRWRWLTVHIARRHTRKGGG